MAEAVLEKQEKNETKEKDASNKQESNVAVAQKKKTSGKEKMGQAGKKVGGFFSEFGKFISKGNVIGMAIGIVIGVAFQAIVNSLVKDIIMPLISLIAKVNITEAKVVLVEATATAEAVTLNYGIFIQSVIDFIIIAFAIFIAIKVGSNLGKKFTGMVETVKTKTSKKKKGDVSVIETQVVTETKTIEEVK